MIKNLEYYLSLPYTVTVKRGTGRGQKYWVARIVELPHCMTHGSSREEALLDIEDAKREWLQSNIDAALAIPEPAKFSGQFHVRMPPALHEALALKSESENIPLNQLIVSALASSAGYSEPVKSKRREPSREEYTAMVKESPAGYGRDSDLQFVTDKNGKRVAVLVPIHEYSRISQRLEQLEAQKR